MPRNKPVVTQQFLWEREPARAGQLSLRRAQIVRSAITIADVEGDTSDHHAADCGCAGGGRDVAYRHVSNKDELLRI